MNTRFFIKRPIGVLMTFLAALVFGVIAWLQLPVSLFPDTAIPALNIRINDEGASPQAVEQEVMAPIRQKLSNLAGLTHLESKATNGGGWVNLHFDYGTDMQLTYVEVNEKLDQLHTVFPTDLPRPQVIRVNAADVPMVKMQIVPKQAHRMIETSHLVEEVLKKRLEQIPGVAMVDLHGWRKEQVVIAPDAERLKSLKLTKEAVETAIQQANQQLGGIEVKDGQYRYFMRIENKLQSANNLDSLPVLLPNEGYVPLYKVAKVIRSEQAAKGFHFYNHHEALVLNIYKQPEARMQEVAERVQATYEQLKIDYPQVDLYLTASQSGLLHASIKNLVGSLFFGGLFAFLILFLFMGSYKLPLIMGISLPVSLIISFLLFYFLGISINIVSLSGLALGLGMLIDNAIVVLDNITQWRHQGLPFLEACTKGVKEIQGALISSVLTTLAVFFPLILLSGITGTLFYDQAVAIAIILSVSLLVAFILLPVLYALVLHKHEMPKEDSTFFIKLKSGFVQSHHWTQRHKGATMAFAFGLIILAAVALEYMQVSGFPKLPGKDMVINIEWNGAVGLDENVKRVNRVADFIQPYAEFTTQDVGIQQFLMNPELQEVQQAKLFVHCKTDKDRQQLTQELGGHIRKWYPKALVKVGRASNAFEQLFPQDQPFLVLKWRVPANGSRNETDFQHNLLTDFPDAHYEKTRALSEIRQLRLSINYDRLQQYGIPASQVVQKIAEDLQPSRITRIDHLNYFTPVQFQKGTQEVSHFLSETEVSNQAGVHYPLSLLVNVAQDKQFKNILADEAGRYWSVTLPNLEKKAAIDSWGQKHDLILKWEGKYFQNKAQLHQLLFILLVSVALLYFILAAQFESFTQPLIVLLTLPFGIAGSILFLWVSGTSLNLMAGMGIIVMLGIMVNDAILKVDTINRMREEMGSEDATLKVVLRKAGELRLKPILMTSLTTILALLPVVFSGGLGSALQQPLVWSVMGGLGVGTVTALYIVPIFYQWLSKKGG